MKTLLFAALATVALVGCASTGSLSDEQRLAIYREHAGEPVGKFHYQGTLHSWESLGDRALVVWDTPNRGYLLTLAHDCPDLDRSRAISFSDQTGNVFAGMDSVVILDQLSPSIPCRIQQIQPLKGDQARQAQRAARDAQSASGD